MLRRTALSAALLPLALLAPPALRGAILPAGFAETRVASGLENPTTMAVAPDGRLFVAEQGGRLRVIVEGVLLPQPFLTVPVSSAGERGLVGVAFDPDFEANRYVYVYYTATTPTIHNRLSRFTAEGDRAAPGSETVLLDLEDLSDAAIHNGGALHFGPDGTLFVAVGDNSRGPNAQTLENRLGKILRIAKDGTIPADNPFFAAAQGDNRAIWALGLRNPFSFAVEPETGRILVNDVGQSSWEEIDAGAPGANFGWPATEGPTDDPRYQAPLFAYPHSGGAIHGCAITGGVFYRPPVQQFPARYRGSYFFADFCGGWIRRLNPATGRTALFATGIAAPVDLDVAADGSLYYLAYESGEVFRVERAADQAPRIAVQPADRTVARGQAAAFRVSASGTAPLRYRWRRDGKPIAGATAAAYTLAPAAVADDGAVFDVVVANAFGSVASDPAALRVLDDSLPAAVIAAPAGGTLYSAGDTVAFAGAGTDPEDGALSPDALTWRIDFHHHDHIHPFLLASSGLAEGTFTIPRVGETSADVWYRIHLTARDSAGLTHSTFVDVLPRTARLTLETDPPALQVTLDGEPVRGPATAVGVVGITRLLGVVSPQLLDGVPYTFGGWSDGGAAEHAVDTPAVDTAYTATFHVTTEGYGLTGTYYDVPGLQGPEVVRFDPAIDFDWGTGAPVPGFERNNWSVRWTGQVQAKVTGRHAFVTRTDDGVRLWVNGRLLIDDWTRGPLRENRGTIRLVAGRRYDLRMEYLEHRHQASARLLWSAPGLELEVVPTSQLYP